MIWKECEYYDLREGYANHVDTCLIERRDVKSREIYTVHHIKTCEGCPIFRKQKLDTLLNDIEKATAQTQDRIEDQDD